LHSLRAFFLGASLSTSCLLHSLRPYFFYARVFRRAAHCIHSIRIFRRESLDGLPIAFTPSVFFFRRESLDELPIAFIPSVSFFRRETLDELPIAFAPFVFLGASL